MSLFNKITALWNPPPPPAKPAIPTLSEWYGRLPHHPSATLAEASETPITFTHEHLKLPPVLNCDNLVIYNGVRAPGGTAMHIEHIVIYGGKAAFRMLGLYLIAAAVRIKYDEPVMLMCTNKELSPCNGIRIGMPRQSKLEQLLQLAPAILTQWSWTPEIPEAKPEHWTKEINIANFPADHLPWLRLGSPDYVYTEHHRPRADTPIITHLSGTLPALCWLGRGLLNFSLDDNPAKTLSLLNYGGQTSLAPGSAELRCVTPGGLEAHPSLHAWLEKQRPPAPPEPEPAPPTPAEAEEKPPAPAVEAAPAPSAPTAEPAAPEKAAESPAPAEPASAAVPAASTSEAAPAPAAPEKAAAEEKTPAAA